MADDQIIASCKDALRIPPDVADYDSEIADLVFSARAALRAGGVSARKIDKADDGAINLAIKVFVKANFGMDNPDSEKLQESFDHLVTMLKGSSEYGGAS